MKVITKKEKLELYQSRILYFLNYFHSIEFMFEEDKEVFDETIDMLKIIYNIIEEEQQVTKSSIDEILNLATEFRLEIESTYF